MPGPSSPPHETPPYEKRAGPPGTRFTEVRRFDELDSTNRYLIDESLAGAPDGLVAVAGHQTAGRGRLGRRWETPPGANLLASVLLRPVLTPSELHLVTVVVALAAADACAEVADVDCALEWPNDLYVGTRKLAGVLAESVPTGRRAELDRPEGGGREEVGGRAVVVGLGLNVQWPAPESEVSAPPVPAELEAIATSLWRETARRGRPARLEPLVVLEVVLAGLEHRVADLAHDHGRRRQAAEYRRRCATVGKRVRVRTGDEVLEGTAIDVTDQGHLLLDTGGGFRNVSAGDVVHVG